MFSKRDIERLTGVLLVASFVAFLGHVVTLGTLGAGATTIQFVFIYGILIFLSAVALYVTFRPHEEILALFGSVALAAHGLLIVLTCTFLLAGLVFPQEFATFGAETDAGVASAIESTMDKIRTSSFIFLCLGLAPLGVLIAWSGAVARWVGWAAIVGGTLGFLSMLAAVFGIDVGGLGSILLPIVAITTFGFMLVLGVRLIVRETRAVVSPA